MRSITRRLALHLTFAALMLGLAPAALAHPGHAAPMIEITKPSAGSLTLKDIEVGAKPKDVAPDAPALASSGDDLTITTAWKCPDGAGGASVTIDVTDADGASAHSAGQGSLAPNASYSTTWKGMKAGTFTITTTLECYRFDNRVQPPVRISMGSDTHTRTVTVI